MRDLGLFLAVLLIFLGTYYKIYYVGRY
jgi:hypothetical protein